MIKKLLSMLALGSYAFLLICSVNFANVSPCHSEKSVSMDIENFATEKKCKSCVEAVSIKTETRQQKKIFLNVGILPMPIVWQPQILKNNRISRFKIYKPPLDLNIKNRRHQKIIFRI